MVKSELVRRVAKQTGFSAEAVRVVLDAVNDQARQALSMGQEVMLCGLGKLVTVHRRERPARNPRSGEPVTVPAHNQVVLRPSVGLTLAANAS